MLFVSNRLYNKTLNTSLLKVKVDATASYLPIDIDADADADADVNLFMKRPRAAADIMTIHCANIES